MGVQTGYLQTIGRSNEDILKLNKRLASFFLPAEQYYNIRLF